MKPSMPAGKSEEEQKEELLSQLFDKVDIASSDVAMTSEETLNMLVAIKKKLLAD